MSMRTQPMLGILALIVAIAISLGIISLFEAQTFATWVTFFVAVCVPVEVVFGMVWQLNYPPAVKNMGQPAKGIVFLLLTLVTAAVIATIIFYTQAAAMAPPTPFALIYVIFAVLMTFWFVVVWGCWPLSAVSKNPLVLGIGTLLVTYLLGYLLFVLLFDFGFLTEAPFYAAVLDPSGAFPAFDILAYAVTTVSVVFLFILFDFWPMTAVPKLRAQPLLGLVSTPVILALAGILYWIGVGVIGMDPVEFMVHVSIGFLFGSLLPIIMFEGSLFAHLAQPAKGLAQFVIAVVAGALLPRLYWALAPAVSGPLVAGAPNYQYELWLASALLAMTFPIMVVIGQFFNFWPLRGKAAPQAVTTPAE